MTTFDTVIIGAGAAGIAAARHLMASSQKLLLLEARHRPGGRAVTDASLGVPADLGAAWLHFAEENAWTHLASDLGFHVIRREPGWGRDTGIGGHLPSDADRDANSAHFQRYFELVESSAATGKDCALCDILPRDDFRARFDATMTWAVGAESSRISLQDLSRYADSHHNWAVSEGLGAVVAKSASGLPIRYGEVVSRIDWSGKRVRITSQSGELEASAVIVTVPPSVLAAGAIRFAPELPAAYLEAFHGLPLGVVNKVFFQLANPAIAADVCRHFIGRNTTSRTCSYQLYPADQPLLSAYFGGDLSQELEQRGELEQFARDELRSVLGPDFVNGLGRTLTTAWGTDPWAQGSYSVALPGKAHSRETLQKPLAPQLWFAGEACSVQHYGTLHGAWLSGVAAAEQLARASLTT